MTSELVPYVVQPGDHLPLLASSMGFVAATVWGHPDNTALRKLRKDMHILAPGDVIYLPPPKRTFFPLTIGSTNNFSAKPVTIDVSIVFAPKGEPLKNEPCVVHGIRGPNEFTTDGDGKLLLHLHISTKVIFVQFKNKPIVQRFAIGHMDPVAVPSGIKQRLENLGHMPPAALFPPHLHDGLQKIGLLLFQAAHGLNATGEMDDATEAKLESAHGC